MLVVQKLLAVVLLAVVFSDDEAMEYLKPYLDTEFAIALKADNGQYIQRIWVGYNSYEPWEETKNINTALRVFRYDDDKVFFKGKDDSILCLKNTVQTHGRENNLRKYYLRSKSSAGSLCHFTPLLKVNDAGVQKILFKGANGKYLNRYGGFANGRDAIVADTTDPGSIYAQFSLEENVPREIVSFVFDVDAASIADTTPEYLCDIVVRADCTDCLVYGEFNSEEASACREEFCRDVTKEFTVAEDRTETSSFEYSTGISIAVGISFTAGIPGIAENEVSIDIENNHQWTWGTEVSTTKSYSDTDYCTAAPGTMVTCVASAQVGRLNVPFEITWSDGNITRGIYKGVQYGKLNLDSKMTFLHLI